MRRQCLHCGIEPGATFTVEGHNTMKCTNSVSQFSCRGFSFRVIAVCLLALWSAAAIAQVTSGTISGEVKDPSGAMIPNATVTLNAPAIGVTRNVTSNDDGVFVVPNLPPGTYNITVEAQGFKKLEKTNVILTAASKLSAGDFVMSVGGGDSSVTVSAEAAQLQLQAESGERSDLISGKQLNDVALNGRMVLDYMKLIPGVVSSYSGAVSGTGGIDAFNINGTRANQHEFTIDGASNVDTGNNGGTHVTINTDAIQEVKVLTSNYQAEFGKAAGGQIAIVTRGGTNEFHGNARYFHRHEGLNANDWFNKKNGGEIGKYRYNYAGYQVGGPVLLPFTEFNKSRDKLYFFWSQEFYRQLVPVSGVTQFYTPTELERQGDFSQSFDGNGDPIVIAGPGVVNNRIDYNLLTPQQQTVFTEVQKILNLYPLPNVSGENRFNYATTISFGNPRREDILRADYQINSNNRIFARWINNSDTQAAQILPWPGFGTFACAGAIDFPGGCTSEHPGWNVSVNWTSTIRPTLLNEFSVGPSVTKTVSEGVNGNISVGANNINLPLFFPVDPLQSIPDMGFGDVPGVDFGWSYLGATPWFQKNTTINVNDNLTWVKSNHTLKFGVFYQRNRKDQIAWGNVNGQFNFKRTPTAGGSCPIGVTCTLGDPYASALLGAFDSFSQSSARPTGYFRYNQLELYAQDTWKLTPRFTVDFGMRFSWIPPQYDDLNQVAIFSPEFYDPAAAVSIDSNSGQIITAAGGDLLNGVRFTSDSDFPKGGWDDRGIMPEPRVGFAYDLFGDHSTVLRGGFGMMHDRTQGNLIFNNVFNNPALVVTPTVSNENIANLPALADSAVSGLTSPLGSIFGAEQSGKVPTVYSFSVGIQRDLGAGTTLDLAYVGTMSRHLVTARDINAVPYGTTFTAAAQNPANFGGVVPAVEPNLPPEYAAAGLNFSGAYAYPTAYLVPFKGYGQISYLKFDGTSNYNSLQASVQRRFSRGLTFGAAYTWSKSLTTANGDEDYVDPFQPTLSYRVAGWDRTHVLAINYVYDLPSLTKRFGGPKWLSYITDNFQLSGVSNFMTGTPVDVPIWVPGNVWTGSQDWSKTPAVYLTVDANGDVLTPQVGGPTRGTRDALRSGGLHNWDMSLFKNFPLGNEQRYVQLRVEAFNVFNHPNFNGRNSWANVIAPHWDATNSVMVPTTVEVPSDFGDYNSVYGGTGGPRVIQLGAKIYF
jgi:hypothetical protein